MGRAERGQRRMIGVMTRHRVQVLRSAGLTHRAIAEQSGISERSVRTICGEPSVEDLAVEALAQRRGAGRPSVLDEHRERLAALLAEEPQLATVEILHRIRGQGYRGGKTALYEAVRELRPRPVPPPLVRFEGVPGEFSQHDFGAVDVRYTGGGRERLHFFASRLKYSRWIDVRLVPNERVESLVRSLLLAFEAFGGVPLVTVFDNASTVTTGREGSRIQWNDTFGQVALDYRFAPELCTPGRAQEKGSVENLVGFVKGSFFKQRRFHDRDDTVSQLVEWHHEVNILRPCRATGVPPAERIAAERERLRPLAIPPSEYALRFPVVVGPTALVTFEGRRYSVAPEAIGIPGSLWLYPERVRIVTGRFESIHPRVPEHGRDSILPEHRTARLAKVAGDRGRLYLKRQEILDLGPIAEAFLTEIVHRHRFTWKGEVDELHDALLAYGPASLARTLERAHKRRLWGAQHVIALLAGEVA
jgi:transposase